MLVAQLVRCVQEAPLLVDFQRSNPPTITSFEFAGLIAHDKEYQPWPLAHVDDGWVGVAAQFAPPSVLFHIVGTWWLPLSGHAYKTLPLIPSSVLWLKVVKAVVAAVQPVEDVAVSGLSVNL